MNDRDSKAIDASLRRQFEPPSLTALEDRIAAAAAAMEAEDAGPVAAVRNAANHPGPRSLGWTAALAAAAALVLVLAWPDSARVTTPGTTAGSSETPRIAVAEAPRRVAGQQLHDFLRVAAYESQLDPESCATVDPAPEHCAAELGAPVLPLAADMHVVWECGGTTGVDCGAHDLPAQRMMIVRLLPAGPDVIVCIEPPWADPRPELPDDSDYTIFRRTLGEYVLYEVTPLGEPRALPRLTI